MCLGFLQHLMKHEVLAHTVYLNASIRSTEYCVSAEGVKKITSGQSKFDAANLYIYPSVLSLSRGEMKPKGFF